MLSKPKDRRIAALLALAGIILPLSGFHKFYLKQPGWGILYLLLSWTLIPKIASGIEGVWYLFQDPDTFNRLYGYPLYAEPIGAERANRASGIEPGQVATVAEAVRQLEQLRQDGLISEYEFEQKRRKLLDQIG
jgi:TM2 domain-containing membrane protein YozV